MMIKIGDKLPAATFTIMTAEGPTPVTTDMIFSGKTVVLFGLPGAFTPTCHNSHVPGFVEKAQDFAEKGVDTIACVSVNDVFVMDAWKDQVAPGGEVMMLADGNADFTRAIGLETDSSAFGMGIRSSRYSMLVEDGVVKSLNREEARGKAEISGAETILAQL